MLMAMTIATMLSHKLIYANPLWLDDGPMDDIGDDCYADADRQLHYQSLFTLLALLHERKHNQNANTNIVDNYMCVGKGRGKRVGVVSLHLAK